MAETAAPKPFKAFLAIAILACVVRVVISQYIFRDFVDDAYIYLRYCNNWDAGGGLVYNAGERVIAFTSYLYVIAIAALDKVTLGLAPTAVVKIFNTVVFAVYCAFLWRFLDRSRPLYWATAIFLLFYFPFIDATVSGMETTLFLAILTLTLVAVREDRFELAIAVAAVAVVTRPEGALLLIAVCASAFGRLSWRQRGRAAAWVAAIFAVILVPIYLYFGTVLPHSMLAKSAHVTESSWAGIPTNPFIKAVLVALGMSDSFYLGLPASVRALFLAAFVVLLAAFVTAVVRAWRKDLAVVVAAAFYVLVVCFYVVGNPVRIFSWYTIAPAMCFTLVAVYGIEEWIALRWKSPARWVPPGIAALVAVVCAASVVVALPSRVASVNGHVGDLRALGQRIVRDYPAADSLLIADIGIIGYTTDLRIIDLAGLVSPVSVAQENGRKVSFGRIVELSDPDVICLENDPLTAATINESSLRHRSFDDELQKARFLGAYEPRSLGSLVCQYGFVRRDLVD